MQKTVYGIHQKVFLMMLLLLVPILTYGQQVINNDQSLFKTNLTDLSTDGGSWVVDETGLTSNVSGDRFVFSNQKLSDFTYTADVTFHNRNNAAASLMIRGDKDLSKKNMYIANINGQTGDVRLFKFQNNAALDLVGSKKIALTADNRYHLELTALGTHLVLTINDQLMINTADYTFSSVLGQNDAFMEGYAGFLSWNANVTYQNAWVTPITASNNPQLKTLHVSSVDGKVEHNLVYKPEQYVYICYVSDSTSQLNLNFTKLTEAAVVTVTNSANKVLAPTNILVNVGKNTFTLISQLADATLVYRVVVIRRKPAETYYNEKYRGQYHWSVKEGWSNDPNGLVFYKGEYHLFHQFFTDTNWGPMHWGHSISKDLIHWEEQPVELYPDEYGTMFSGCAVVDEKNTSGLFTELNGEKSLTGGLVALITADGNGERVTLAYSKDGKTWKKHPGVVKDWTEDPLNNAAFRDPKVFRYQDKWFMVIAGGPLRIYSSDNLIDWSVESTYPGLDTECPDFYRLPVMNGSSITEYKWVLSRGGRYYKIGDFKQLAGKWTFVMDSRYTNYGSSNDGWMNFAPDSYAAMTYSNGSFDEYQRVIQVNWMNSPGYGGNIDNLSNNTVFNGSFNMQLELTLTKDSKGNYLLQQTPIREYQSLRNLEKAQIIQGLSVNNEKKALNYQGQTYELVAEFMPETGVTDLGFLVRASANTFTRVGYSVKDDKFYLDRSKSGLSMDNFLLSYAQKSVLTKEGKIQLHIFVDRASVELFADNYTISGAVQIFPTAFCDGVEVYSTGGKSLVDVHLYPLNTIWTQKMTVTKPTEVLLESLSLTKYVTDSFTMKAQILPYDIQQAVTWQMAANDVVSMQTDGSTASFKALKAGTIKVRALSTVNNAIYKEFTITVLNQVQNIQPSNPNIQYMGRIDFSDPEKPLFAYPNVTIKATFEGTALNILLKHYNGSDFADNYFVAVIDGKAPVKFRVTALQEIYPIAKNLKDTIHQVELIKVTESYCGECQFLGLQIDLGKKLVTPAPLPDLKLEFFGNSITCGFGIEGGSQPASDNSYRAYPSVTARLLNAQYHTTSYSGIGVVKGFPAFLMADMYKRTIALTSYKPFPVNNNWDFTRYVPQVVVVALGTNDYNLGFGNGTISAATFNNGYKSMITKIRTVYPNAHIVCTNSPMISDMKLGTSVQTVVSLLKTAGDEKLHYFEFANQIGGGWGGHPGMTDGQNMGKALAAFIQTLGNLSPVQDVQIDEKGLIISPNPAVNSVLISSDKRADQLEITDLSGKIIQKLSVSFPGETTLNTVNYPVGCYVCTLRMGTENLMVKKMYKK